MRPHLPATSQNVHLNTSPILSLLTFGLLPKKGESEGKENSTWGAQPTAARRHINQRTGWRKGLRSFHQRDKQQDTRTRAGRDTQHLLELQETSTSWKHLRGHKNHEKDHCTQCFFPMFLKGRSAFNSFALNLGESIEFDAPKTRASASAGGRRQVLVCKGRKTLSPCPAPRLLPSGIYRALRSQPHPPLAASQRRRQTKRVLPDATFPFRPTSHRQEQGRWPLAPGFPGS